MMMKAKQLCALLLGILIACVPLSAALAAEQSSPVDIIDEAKLSVVRVFAGNSFGTGFLVGKEGEAPQYVLTNDHVVSDDPHHVSISITDKDTLLPASIVMRWDHTVAGNPDVALLKLEEPLQGRKPLKLRPPDTVRVGESVHALGFPGLSDAGEDMGVYRPSSIENISVTSGTITKADYLESNVSYFQTDAEVSGGNSGGPLIDAQGAAIGMNSWILLSEQGKVNYALYSDYLIAILQEYTVPFTLAGEPTAQEPAPAPEPAPASGGGSAILWVLLAVVIIGAGAFFFFKKKGGATPKSGAKLELKCVEGALKDSVYPLSGSMRIGRSAAQCQIVFPDKTEGISGLHCEVVSAGDAATLTDLGSTYGTFLADGTKLAPNQPHTLQKGELFFLASKKNGFRLQ